MNRPGQTRAGSLAEAALNVAIGLGISWAANLVILPRYGCAISITASVEIAAAFTLISLARGYLLRRLFNRFF